MGGEERNAATAAAAAGGDGCTVGAAPRCGGSGVVSRRAGARSLALVPGFALSGLEAAATAPAAAFARIGANYNGGLIPASGWFVGGRGWAARSGAEEHACMHASMGRQMGRISGEGGRQLHALSATRQSASSSFPFRSFELPNCGDVIYFGLPRGEGCANLRPAAAAPPTAAARTRSRRVGPPWPGTSVWVAHGAAAPGRSRWIRRACIPAPRGRACARAGVGEGARAAARGTCPTAESAAARGACPTADDAAARGASPTAEGAAARGARAAA
eukprot:119605-Chlamydomonas_euryale.AAC.3